MTQQNTNVTIHQASPADKFLTIYATGEMGVGNAYQHYLVLDASREPANISQNDHGAITVHYDALLDIRFQSKPIADVGLDGVTNEALVAIVLHRLEGFQNGPFACAENAEAVYHFTKGLEALQRRTRERLERGVEGTSTL